MAVYFYLWVGEQNKKNNSWYSGGIYDDISLIAMRRFLRFFGWSSSFLISLFV